MKANYKNSTHPVVSTAKIKKPFAAILPRCCEIAELLNPLFDPI